MNYIVKLFNETNGCYENVIIKSNEDVQDLLKILSNKITLDSVSSIDGTIYNLSEFIAEYK